MAVSCTGWFDRLRQKDSHDIKPTPGNVAMWRSVQSYTDGRIDNNEQGRMGYPRKTLSSSVCVE
jgi:hypothetical protein